MSFLILVLVALATAERKSYEGYKMYELNCENMAQKDAIHALTEEVDIWKHSRIIGDSSSVMVSPARDYWFTQLLAKHNIPHHVVEDNMQTVVDRDYAYAAVHKNYDPLAYNDLQTIWDEMYVMESDCNAIGSGVYCEVRDLGNSYEGRPLKALGVFKTGNAPDGNPRRAVVIDSTIHAREWIATSSNVNFMDKMARQYGSDAEVTDMLDKFNFFFLPVVNPDGYSYTWTNDRMWRKNRAPNSGSPCVGTDLNRNYDYQWGEAGASSNPCSETYHGDSPASEPETQVIQEQSYYMWENDNVISWTSAHTYGEYWLHSYGGTVTGTQNGACSRSDDHDDLYQVADETRQAIEAVHNTGGTWRYGSICETIYAASGGTIDYIHGSSHVKYSYTPEFRGNSFNPPESEIPIAFEEFWAGLRQQVMSMYNIEFGAYL